MGIAPKGMEQGSIEFRVLCFLCPHSISLIDFFGFSSPYKAADQESRGPSDPTWATHNRDHGPQPRQWEQGDFQPKP